MSESEWFIIQDLEDFTHKARSIVYNNFGTWDSKNDVDILIDEVKESEQAEFDKMLSHQESMVIVKENVKKQRSKKTGKVRFILNDTIFSEIVCKLNDRMVSNILGGLVSKGLVETAFDDETNDFVFWVKDNEDKNEIEKPETD